jgi:uncharacterized protein (TIGR02118 family)
MIKLIYCLHRLEGMSREDFQKYWYDEHAPLVRSVGEVLKIRRYVQCHTLNSDMNAALVESRQSPQEFDGVAELWWDSEEDLAEAMSSEEGQDAARRLVEDEAKFIDFERSPLWVGNERPVIGS